MEAIAVQVQAPVQQAVQTGITARDITAGSINQGQVSSMGGGGFIALMMQLLNGMAELPAQDGQTDEGGKDGLEKELEKDGAELGAQMLAEMLAANPAMTAADVSEILGQDAAALIQPTGTAAAGTNANELLAILTGQSQTAKPADIAQTAEPVLAGEVVSVQKSEGQSAPQQGAADDGFSGEAQFKQAVMQAQKMMRSKPATGEAAEPIDIDKLQSKVDANKAVVGTVRTENPMPTLETKTAEIALPDAKELLTQVKMGILSGMNSGKNEFVIKLKPDGLGEITVRLAETGSRMSLSIIASTAQTQRLISSEMAGLREAMKPLGVEVQQVASQEAGHFNAEQQNNFGGHQHQQFQDSHPQNEALYWNEDVPDGEIPVMAYAGQASPDRTLDTYI